MQYMMVEEAKLMDMEASTILPCLDCEEQETIDSVIITSSSSELKYNRRCISLPTRPSSKSLSDPTLLSKSALRFKVHNKKQGIVIKWKALVSVAMFRRRVIGTTRKTLVMKHGKESEPESESETDCLVSDCECRIDIPCLSGVKTIESPSLINEDEPCTENVAATSVQPTRVPSVLNLVIMVFLHLSTMAKSVAKWTCRWEVWKWLFKLLNFGFEAIQLTFATKNNQGKLGNHKYLLLSFITSVICLVIAVIEFFGEVKYKRATWQIKKWWCWYYYPSGRVFGNFCLYFGVGSSIIQVVFNSVGLHYNKTWNFDFLPFMFSLFQLFASGFNHGEESPQRERVTSSLIGSEIQCDQLLERRLEMGGKLVGNANISFVESN